MIELFGSALVTFLVIIDPPGCAPIFASLTRGASAADRRAMAIRSSIIAWAILMFFALLGRPMLNALGNSLASFRIAEADDISVFPMAIPMIAGPGSIASAMLWVSRAETPIHIVVVLAAITVVILLTMATLLAAGPLMRLIGLKVETVITRILGVILAALASQFVIDGLRQSFPALG